MNKYLALLGEVHIHPSRRRSAAQPREDEYWVAKVQKADVAEPAAPQCLNTLPAAKSKGRTSSQRTDGHVRQCNGVS